MAACCDNNIGITGRMNFFDNTGKKIPVHFLLQLKNDNRLVVERKKPRNLKP